MKEYTLVIIYFIIFFGLITIAYYNIHDGRLSLSGLYNGFVLVEVPIVTGLGALVIVDKYLESKGRDE